MRYAGLIKNDFSAAPGTSVTFFSQGCPHYCAGCHNPETWDFSGGKEFETDTLQEILDALRANGIKRNFCIMGGEPLCPENQFQTLLLVNSIKEKIPDTKIYIWTGYKLEDIIHTNKIDQILEKTNYLIDGPYIDSLRDISLFMRGSSNQRVLENGKDFFVDLSEKI